ncbi:MAG: hypothetical protein ACKO4Q_18945 [Planctomycetota bacterium]
MLRLVVNFVLAALIAAASAGLVVVAFIERGSPESVGDDVLVHPPASSRWSSVRPPGPGECRRARTLEDGRVALSIGEAEFAFDAARMTFARIDRPPISTNYPPAGVPGYWHAVGPRGSIAMPQGSCAFVIAPGARVLPALPLCPGGDTSITAATVLADGTVHAVLYDGARRVHRSFTLRPGHSAFEDRGTIAFRAAAAALEPGVGTRALLIVGDGTMVAFDPAALRPLPAPQPARYAQHAAVTGDGTVVLCGGRRAGVSPRHALVCCVPVLPLLVLVTLWAVLRSRGWSSLPGLILGLVAGVLGVCAVVAYIFLSSGRY